jgi:hypothetical protein
MRCTILRTVRFVLKISTAPPHEVYEVQTRCVYLQRATHHICDRSCEQPLGHVREKMADSWAIPSGETLACLTNCEVDAPQVCGFDASVFQRKRQQLASLLL